MDEEKIPTRRLVGVYLFLALVVAMTIASINWNVTKADWQDYATCKKLAAPYTGEFLGCMQHFKAVRGG